MEELKKGKYKLEEVKRLLNACQTEYSEKINELKEKLIELTEQNKNLSAQLEIYKRDEDLISRSIIDAQNKAKEIEKTANSNYAVTVTNLKKFLLKWAEYFKYLTDKYPYYPAVKQSVELCGEVNKILEKERDESAVVTIENRFNELSSSADGFNPRARIQDYIATTGENGFNLDEVLNPGELRLEDLCRDLGLLEEND